MEFLLKNGIIITSTQSYRSDILVSDGIISGIATEIPDKPGLNMIDAGGCYILPGGVDPHVHMHLPTPAGYSSDDFFTGTRAALYGGTTTIMDFVTPENGQSLPDALINRKNEASSSLIDYSFHVSPVQWNISTENEIFECIAQGISSFKVYMAYKDSIGLNDEDLFMVMKAAGKKGKVVMVHCESGDEIEGLRNKFYSENHTEPKYHPLSRPSSLEAAAVKRAIDMAEKAECILYIVHVSAKESLKYIEEAQKKGLKVFAETCPQYLLLDDSKYEGCFTDTAPYMISPPLRKKKDNKALWNAASKGIIQTIGTDHCPFSMDQKNLGKADFRKIPNGAGGVEHRLELLFTYGVLTKKISLNKLVDLFSTRPARIFGIYPSKGEIKVGSDADLVIWNPDPENIISSKTHHQNCDINIYEGTKTRGRAEYVFLRGNIAIEKGNMVNPDIKGKFIRR